MRGLFFLAGMLWLFGGCNNKKPEQAVVPQAAAEATPDSMDNFFPVTTYIKGEIFNIKNIGITPVRKITVGNHTDSSFVKAETYDSVFADFISPVIDTANLKGIFTETKFLDQTLNAFTFSYDPAGEKAAAFPFIHWDVYIDAETNKVRRVYLVKKISAEKTRQLTWQSGKWCKIITLKTAGDKAGIVSEEKIKWTYENEE